MSLTLREQLAAQVARIRDGTTPMRPALTSTGFAFRVGEITLEYWSGRLPIVALRGALGRVNAARIGDAEAGHLLLKGSEVRRDDSFGPPTARISIHLLYGNRPWDQLGPAHDACAIADFDALLASLEPWASPEPPPDRPETWHDRPGML